jgi:hypothetical protein
LAASNQAEGELGCWAAMTYLLGSVVMFEP